MTLIPFSSPNYSASPSLYYNLLEDINLRNNSKLVFYSRNITIPLFNKNFDICSSQLECSKGVDYLLLSNIKHDSIGSPEGWEESSLLKNKIIFNNKTCIKESIIYKNDDIFSRFSCLEN